MVLLILILAGLLLFMRRFLLGFIILLLIMFGLELLQPVQEHIILPFTGLLASVCSFLVSAFDTRAIAYGKVLQDSASGFAISIEAGCNGVEACIVLIAAILAFPAPWRYKLKGIVLGIIAIQLLNIVRVISLFYLGQWDMDWFMFAHTYLWQTLIMLDVLLVFMIWIWRMPVSLPAETVNEG